MTSTASPLASRIRDARPIAAHRAGAATHGNTEPSERIAARLQRYARDTQSPPPTRLRSPAREIGAPQIHSQADASSGADSATFPGLDASLRQASEDTSRRIEAAISDAVGDAVRELRNDILAGANDPSWLHSLHERLEALEAASDIIARSVTAAVDERLDAVDDHLADLTRTFTQQAGEQTGAGSGELHAELAALTLAVRETALQQIPDEILEQAIARALRSAPQPAAIDLEASVTRPVLAALDAVVAQLAAQGRDSAAEDHDVRAASLAHAVRDELASARVAKASDFRQVETRLDALQDSVVEITRQLREAREATEQADRIAHANALAVAGPRLTPARPAPERSPSERSAATTMASPALPRAATLTSSAPPASPSPADIRSRFITAARRANATSSKGMTQPGKNDGQPATGSTDGAKRASQVAGWMRGKGLLWAAAVVILAGSVPLLAPALRALPDAVLSAASNGDPGPATPARPKIGSHLTTSTARPASIVDDPAALYALGDRIAEGSEVGSPKLAATLLEKAAERGQAPAQYRIARLYEKGAGVPRDLGRARTWYTRAAEQGNIRSMHNLAVMFADNGSAAPDYATAANWFRKAAERGLADSQYNLGVLLARGLGATANAAEAWKWFDIGARNGDMEAAERRDEIAASMSPDTLAAAKAASEAWRPTPAEANANDPAPSAAQQPAATAGASTSGNGRPA